MKRRAFIQQSAVITTAFCFGIPPEPVIGHGGFRYRIDQHWSKADATKFPVNNCHELVMDKAGRIFMTTDDTRNNLLIFNKDGRILGSWGREYPGAHGLTIHNENGSEFLYIADYERHQVIKTRLDGRVVQTFNWPAETGKYANQSEFCPTETAIAPNGDVLVADGYGKDYVVRYDSNGYVKQLFGGPGVLKNAHGIAFDDRTKEAPCWLVTSRADNKIKRFSMEGALLQSIDLPGAYICRPVVAGTNVYFAVLISQLPWDSGTGFICILDQNNQVVSAPAANTPRYGADGLLKPLYQTIRAFKHPHDVLVDTDDNLYVAQWNSGNVYPTKLIRV